MSKFLKITFFVVLGIFIIWFIICIILILENQKTQISDTPSIANEEEILNSLTLEQKIGQLFLIGFESKTLTPQLEEFIKTIHPGGIVLISRNIENENQIKKLIESLQKISLQDSALPLFVAVDQEGEPISRIGWLKEKTSESDIKNTEQAYEVGFDRGKELKELGINLNFAPVLDAAQPGDFLYSRSFQKGPNEIGELSKALIAGQKAAGILTTIKHFPGYGGISFNPERVEMPILSKIPEISQFKKAMEAEPEMVMTSNVVYSELNSIYQFTNCYKELDENLPFTLAPKGIQFLKNELKGDYLIISDDLSSPVLKKRIFFKKYDNFSRGDRSRYFNCGWL